MSTYRYQPLQPGEVRLLEFRPSRGDAELDLQIHHKTLDSSLTRYAALSYRWGDPDFCELIRIGKDCLHVTPDLKDALVQIKKHVGDGSPALLLWVDAICIDQSNNREKSQQVLLMGQLYSQADKVIVWLRRPNNDRNVRLAVEKLAFLHQFAIRAMYKSPGAVKPWPWASQSGLQQKRLANLTAQVHKELDKIFDVSSPDAHAAWQGIVEIWRNEWWERAWVAQEATVKEASEFISYLGVSLRRPTPKVRFLCGDHVTSWSPLVQAGIIADILMQLPSIVEHTRFLVDTKTNLSHMADIRRSRAVGIDMSTLDLLQLTRHMKSSNPRDKVYANAGLMAKSTSALLNVEYDGSVADAYLDIVRIELEHSSPASLDFLGYAMRFDEPRRPSSDYLPSWVPNWDDPLRLCPFAKKLHGYNRNVAGRSSKLGDQDWIQDGMISTGKAYNASRDADVDAYISGTELHIKGALLDVVSDRVSYQWTAEDIGSKIASWREQQEEQYPNGEDFDTALLRVQIADIKHDLYRRPVSRGYAADSDFLERDPATLEAAEVTAQIEMSTSLTMATELRGLCLSRRGFLGLVPWATKPGDWICLLMGAQVLYVLRPCAERVGSFEYIGECVAYGLMDGEALDWVNDGNSSVQEFVLV